MGLFKLKKPDLVKPERSVLIVIGSNSNLTGGSGQEVPTVGFPGSWAESWQRDEGHWGLDGMKPFLSLRVA